MFKGIYIGCPVDERKSDDPSIRLQGQWSVIFRTLNGKLS